MANATNRDGKDDYLVLDPKTGELTVYLNGGIDEGSEYGWKWNPIGSIATGLGPGANVRFADIDGDGVSKVERVRVVRFIMANSCCCSLMIISTYIQTAPQPFTGICTIQITRGPSGKRCPTPTLLGSIKDQKRLTSTISTGNAPPKHSSVGS